MKQKIMTSFILTTVFSLLVGGLCVFAKDKDIVNKELLERGYPEYVLDNMCDESKLEIYNDEDLYYCGATIVGYDEETGESTYIDVNDEFSPIGQIPNKDLTLTLTASGKEKSGKLESITFNLDYTWKKTPINRYQDPITLAIDSTNYRMDYDSFRKVDKYVYRDYNNSKKTKIHSDETKAAGISKNGVTWYADLKGGAVDKLFGYGKFKVFSENPTAKGSMDVNFMYAHALTNASVNIPIPQIGGTISVGSGSGSNDQLSDGIYLKWKNGKMEK